MGIENKIYKLESYIVAAGLFLLVPPYFAWTLPTSIGMIIVFAFSARHFTTSNPGRVYSFLLLLLLTIFYFSGSITVIRILIILMLLLLLFLKRSFLFSVFNSFIKLYAIMMFPSLCEYVFYLITGSGFVGGKTIQPLNELKTYTYHAYLFFIVPSHFSFFPRFHSYFDEPGVVGTLSSLLLAIGGYKLKDRDNIIIFVSGLLSLSLYFYVFSIIYFVFFYENKKLKKFTFIFSVIFLSSLFMYVKKLDSPVIEYYIFNRLAIDSDKGFAGNNRDAGDFSLWYREFRKSSDYYFGLGRDAKNTLKINVGGASYKDLIVSYGIIGFTLFCILFLLWAHRNYKGKELLLFVFMFFSLLYQRPFIFSPIYFVLLLFIVSLIKYNNTENETNCSLRGRQLCARSRLLDKENKYSSRCKC